MGVSLKTHKLLWGRSGNRCAFRDCRNDLVADETETDDEAIIGDEAHIVSRKENGPRGRSILDIDGRDKYDNLILLCRKHHKIIDDQHNFYTVEKLHQIKSDHEKWVRESLSFNSEQEKVDLAYASYIDEIVRALDFQNWRGWTSFILGNSSFLYQRYLALEKLPSYIVSRFWPNQYSDLEATIYNLNAVVTDLINVFSRHIAPDKRLENSENTQFKCLETEAFYKIVFHHDESVYNELLREYKFHTALLDDLIFELTRTCNLLIEKIRKYIYPMYREEEGKLLIGEEPSSGYNGDTNVLEYSIEEKLDNPPYKGLADFMVRREKRDKYMGTGVCKQYLSF